MPQYLVCKKILTKHCPVKKALSKKNKQVRKFINTPNGPVWFDNWTDGKRVTFSSLVVIRLSAALIIANKNKL